MSIALIAKRGVGTSTVCAVLLSAVALLSAAPASADETDDAFVAALDRNGIDIDDHNTAIAHGHAVCAALDKGQASSLIALKTMSDTKLNLSARQAGYFIGISVAAYCPEYKGTLDPSLFWLMPFPPMM